uniref:Uncharacterized protein n=1 Tax=Ditylenchus dipsaci TaxID=166011 RepID=A0A915EGF6_9BILA
MDVYGVFLMISLKSWIYRKRFITVYMFRYLTYQYSNMERNTNPLASLQAGNCKWSCRAFSPSSIHQPIERNCDNGYSGPIELDLKVLHQLNGIGDKDNQEK